MEFFSGHKAGARTQDRAVRIPIRPLVRSLNLANAVAVASFEAASALDPDDVWSVFGQAYRAAAVGERQRWSLRSRAVHRPTIQISNGIKARDFDLSPFPLVKTGTVCAETPETSPLWQVTNHDDTRAG